MQNILFFSPYMPWLPHTLWEVTMAYALRQRGHTANFITCQGLPDCGISPAARFDRTVDCQNCRNYTLITLPRLRHTAEFMQAFLTNRELTNVAAWAESLPEEGLQTAEYAGLPLGAWTWPDMISYWHNIEPDLTRSQVVQSYRRLLVGSAMAATSLPRIFDKYNTSVLVTLNGAFFMHRVAFELARARGIRTIAHERGWMDNTVSFNANGLAGDLERYEKRWQAWKGVPLTAEELRAVEHLLTQRRRGLNMNWSAFSPSPQDLTAVRAAANLPDKPMALLCTSSECEGSLADRKPAVTQMEWIEHTVAWFRAHPEYALVIRVHPNELDHAEVDDRPIRRYQALKATLPDNIRLILPDEQVSTYSLMDMATAGLSYGSTAGLEMACQGTPLVHAGLGYYKEAGFTHEITALDAIPRVMAEVMELPRSLEIQRGAYRFMHRMFIGLCVPFTKVKIGKDFFQADLAYESTAELAPGRDKDLDRIVEYILGEAELYPPPSPEQLQLTTEAEDRFFAEQRAAALLQAARQHPDRADLLAQAADTLRAIGLTEEATALCSVVQQRDAEPAVAS